MSLDRALQLTTAALAVTGAAFLALGRTSALMPLVLAAAAVVALFVTDIRRWLLLNRLIANLIALAAVAWSLRDFFEPGGSEQQLLAIADMLVYLQVVLLFQEKSARVYWQLLVLSMLQVVVAAALSLGPQFAVLLGIYVLLALTQLVLLCLQRELARPRAAPRAAVARQPWQMLLAPPVVSGGHPTDSQMVLGSRTIARQVGLLACATLLFTVVFFCATPRLSDGPWQSGRGRAISGLPSEVRMMQSGHITLSDQVVMRVILTRLSDRAPVIVVGEPYFAGLTLNDYVAEGGASRWVQGPRRSRPVTPPGTPLPAGSVASLTAPPPELLVRQDVELELGQANAYPAILPTRRLNDTPRDLRFVRSLNRLERIVSDAEAPQREYRYALATPAIRNSRQLRAIGNPSPLQAMTEAELKSLVQFDLQRFPELARIAGQALQEQNVSAGSQLERAVALERHFLAPDLYRYSLDLSFERDSKLDPIEDFVARHRTGHCEYFASALVMMLRSQGIPARMVIGFKGGELNSLGRYYVVHKKDAHAWVEAWMPPGAVPAGDIAGPADGGSWYRLDPTPSARETISSAGEETLARRLAHTFDYVELLWRDYVLSLNKSRQEDAIYDPLTAQATALPIWLEGRGFQRWVRRWSARLGIDFDPPQGRGGPRVFESTLALVVAGGILVVLGLVQGGLAVRRRVMQWWRGRRQSQPNIAAAPAFYLKLEKLLAHLPLRRRAGQTPQELAAVAEQRLAGGPNGGVAHVPAEIVAAYNRVRFGSARLDKSQTAAIEHALESLAPAVSQKSR